MYSTRFNSRQIDTMKTEPQPILNTQSADPLQGIGRIHARPISGAGQGAKKSPLPFHLLTIRSRPDHNDDISQVQRWMDAENRIAIAKGTGVLFNDFGPEEIRQGLEQERLIFFYLFGRLLGFVRVIELAGNHWEIGSAISSPPFRERYSGFNRLFTASSLLRISTTTAGGSLPLHRVLIVTYNSGVARSLRNLQQPSRERFFTLKDRSFDFSRIRELPTEKAAGLVAIYDLQHKLLAGEIFFLFDVSACLL